MLLSPVAYGCFFGLAFLIVLFCFLLIVLTSADFFSFQASVFTLQFQVFTFQFSDFSFSPLLHPTYSTDQPINNLSHRMELLVSFLFRQNLPIAYNL